MKGRLRSLALAGALAAAPCLAFDRSEGVPMRVVLKDGSAHVGEVHLGNVNLELVEPTGKRLRFSLKQVASLEETTEPPSEADLAKARLEHATRARSIAASDSGAWTQLGLRARKQGLLDAASDDFAKAVAADPEARPARAGLGQVKLDGAWRGARDLAKAVETAPRDDAARIDLASLAAAADEPDEALAILAPTCDKLCVDPAFLALLRPITRTHPPLAFRLPFRGQWVIDADPTHHHEQRSFSTFAVDATKLGPDGLQYKGNGTRNEDHYCFGEPVLAAADGTVVVVRGDEPDLPPRNGRRAGLTIEIEHAPGLVSVYVHLKNNSAEVSVGDRVKAGQEIARVGSGPFMPHLHFDCTWKRGTTAISVPWTATDFRLLLEGGRTPIEVKRGRPAEGQVVETR